jgi:hypothetical protein
MTRKAIARPALWALLAAMAAAPAWAAVDSGSICATAPGDPACLGDVTYSVNTEIPLPPDGILQYGTLTVDSGVTVTFTRNTVNTPVFILASGDVTINGTFSVNAPGPGATDGATHVGIVGDGNPGDDGIPGLGGPGGFAGGYGGPGGDYGGSAGADGGQGLGPGGGGRGLNSGRYRGAGAGYAGGGGGGDATSGGPAYGQASLQPLVGGSGGGGGGGGSDFNGSGGGGGGGAILIASNGTINISSGGRVFADGASGGTSGDRYDTAYAGHGGCGGGGSGGAIRLVATTISGNGQFYARGANGGYCNGYGYAGAGSNGRIRMEAEIFTFSGGTTPTRSFDPEPQPIFVPNNPTLAITGVGGVTVPAEPTGSGDVSLPEDVPQPVTVSLAASEIPLGTTVNVTVKGRQGAPTTYLSTALAGTLASSTATAEVTLPAGPSTLEASTSFTLVIGGGGGGSAKLEYEGEPIETAEVTTASDGSMNVTYVTRSGKRVPEEKVGPLAYALR